MVHSAIDWPWSSYRETIVQKVKSAWLDSDWLLAGFGQRKSKAIDAYKQFVSEGKGQPSPWEQLKNQVFLGDDKFVEAMQGMIEGEKELSEIPASQRRPAPKELSYLCKEVQYAE